MKGKRAMFEPSNATRADWAEKALDTFCDETGADTCDALADLLCDLMHLAERNDLYGDFSEALRCARSNYEAEKAEENDA
jgi:hypothetical protein